MSLFYVSEAKYVFFKGSETSMTHTSLLTKKYSVIKWLEQHILVAHFFSGKGVMPGGACGATESFRFTSSTLDIRVNPPTWQMSNFFSQFGKANSITEKKPSNYCSYKGGLILHEAVFLCVFTSYPRVLQALPPCHSQGEKNWGQSHWGAEERWRSNPVSWLQRFFNRRFKDRFR